MSGVEYEAVDATGVLRRRPFYVDEWSWDGPLESVWVLTGGSVEDWHVLLRVDFCHGGPPKGDTSAEGWAAISGQRQARRAAILGDLLAVAGERVAALAASPPADLGRLGPVEAGVLLAMLGKLLGDPGTDPTVE